MLNFTRSPSEKLMNYKDPTRSLLRSSSLVACIVSFTGCSTLADPPSEGTSDGGPTPIPISDDGVFIECGTGQYVCMPTPHVYCGPYAMDTLYRSATCASTFGGDLGDYFLPSEVFQKVNDWPQAGQNTKKLCETTFNYDNTSETVDGTTYGITNLIPFHGSPLMEGCTTAGYCEVIAAIQQAMLTVDDDPLCNVDDSPTGGNSVGNALLGPWRCIGSGSSACGMAEENNVPSAICPIPADAAVGTDVCVLAVDEEDASEKCTKQCIGMNGAFLLDDSESSSYEVTEELQCDVYDATDMVWVENVDAECAFAHVYPGLVTPTPFDFSASLVTNSGGSTGISGHYGSLDFLISNCSSGQCDISINDIMLPYSSYNGSFSNSTTSLSYSVSGLQVRLLKPVLGVLNESTGGVTFPTSPFEVMVSTGGIILDTVPMSPIDEVFFAADQVVGNYRRGILTLNINYNTIDANMALTITTR